MIVELFMNGGGTLGTPLQGESGRAYVIVMPPVSSGTEGFWVPFRKVIAAAGTPERLVASSTPCKKVIICNPSNNADQIAVGSDNTIRAAAGSEKGIIIMVTGRETLELDDLNDLFGDVSTSGNVICGAYLS